MRVLIAPLLLLACSNDTSLSQIPDIGVPNDRDEDTDPDVSPDATTFGTEHWLAYMENLQLAFNGPPNFAVVARGRQATTVTLTAPQTGFTDTFDVDETWTRYTLPAAILYPQGSNVPGIHGLRLTSDEPVEVLGLHQRLYFSEASRTLPRQELGQRYRVLAVEDVGQANRSSFIVAATEDDTVVTVVPSADTTALFAAGNPVEVELDAGQTYQVHSLEDLSGSLVEATAPVAVFAGGADAAVACGATSHAWDQLLPTRRWGTDSVAVPLHGQGGDVLVVVSDTDGTEVRLDCGEPIVLDAGQAIHETITQATRVTASAPVGVAQLARGSDCTDSRLGDANMVITVPLALHRPGAELYTGFTFEGGQGSPRTGFAVARDGEDGVRADSGYLRGGDEVLEGELRGLGFAVSQFDAYTYSLGYDCEDCVPDLQAEASCGDE